MTAQSASYPFARLYLACTAALQKTRIQASAKGMHCAFRSLLLTAHWTSAREGMTLIMPTCAGLTLWPQSCCVHRR
jgi:hypothetical protein